MTTVQRAEAMFSPPAVDGLTVGSRQCPLYIGTSGYSYTEWSDSGFYPAATRTADMLGEYTRYFPAVELNYTWYQMPRPEAVARMAAKAPEDFLFAAKLTRSLTHDIRDNWSQEVNQYRRGVAPLGSRLAAVLVQLPPDFRRSPANRCYLARLLDGLQGLPVAVEFRHVSWAVDPVFAELERRRVTLVSVDAPDLPELFPHMDIVTNPDFFYLRFHGRNRSGWSSSNMQKKFDYDYSETELRQRTEASIAALSSRADRGLVFFNNHVRAQAPRNARNLQNILKARQWTKQ